MRRTGLPFTGIPHAQADGVHAGWLAGADATGRSVLVFTAVFTVQDMASAFTARFCRHMIHRNTDDTAARPAASSP